MSEKQRVGMFGGTFNPPHVGHVGAALDFITGVSLDLLYVIPDANPPHKPTDPLVSARDRYEMTKLAFADVPRAVVSETEIERGGKSYTADTLDALCAPDRELFLLVGTDMFVTLDEWHDPARIFDRATVCYVRREEDAAMSDLIDERRAYYEKTYGARVIAVPHIPFSVSSSDLRAGERREALPPAVARYIGRYGLYLDPFSREALSGLRIRVAEEMGEKRYRHTLGVEKIAATLGTYLCPGQVPALRAAALLHDVTKEKSGEEISRLVAAYPDESVDFSFPPVVHAATAPLLIQRDYPAYATKEILDAVRLHTTGAPVMSLFSEIVFLSDFVEEGRQFPEAKMIRERLFARLAAHPADPVRVFEEEVLAVYVETLGFLEKKGQAISPVTKEAKEALFDRLFPS